MRPDDVCYCLGEYTAHRDSSFSSMNQLIEQLKIKPASAGASDLQCKESAIQMVAEAFRRGIVADPEFSDIGLSTGVPIPPAAIPGDPLYDDRMFEVVSRLGPGLGLDVRKLVKQYKTVHPTRGSEVRPSIPQLMDNYYVDEHLATPPPTKVLIFDDVLVGGNHYKAMQLVIQQRFSGVPTVGVFVARRVPDEAARMSWREKMRLRAIEEPRSS